MYRKRNKKSNKPYFVKSTERKIKIIYIKNYTYFLTYKQLYSHKHLTPTLYKCI